MEAAKATPSAIWLVWGDNDFAVQRRARQAFDTWNAQNPDGESEVIDATVANAEEALRAVARLREALQTLPFFGRSKTIWLRDCNFAGDDRVSDAQSVVQTLTELGRELTALRWHDLRLLISAVKLDRRRSFFKSLDKLSEANVATIEHFPGLSADDRDWRDKAENLVSVEFRGLGKRVDGDALARFIEYVGPHGRPLAMEAQKLATYVGDRPQINLADVTAVVSQGRHARAFALGDAVGNRDMGQALRHLDDELWAIRSDRQKSEIGLLFGLIGKVRAMLFAREMLALGMVRRTHDYRDFAAQLKKLPPDQFPSDKRCNPLEINAFVMFKAAQQAMNFTREELVSAMEELLRCNRRLVGSGLDVALVLQTAITRIISGNSDSPASQSAA